MDTTEITHISLCSGYGGIDLGLRRVLPNLRTVAYSEIEAFAVELLLARMESGQLDPAPIWSNLKTFPWAEFSGLVDVLSGGYPCQPFSSAGKRLGTEDERHLWPYIASGIRILKPRVCFFENVEGHITLGLSTVISDLEEMGYNVSFGIFSAAETGAPHQRKRVFICALADSIPEGLQRCLRESSDAGRLQQQAGRGSDCVWPSRPREPQHYWEPPRVVGNAESGQDHRREPRDLGLETSQRGCGNYAARGSSASVGNATSQRLEGGQQSSTSRLATDPASSASKSRQAQPALGRDTDGATDWLDYAKLSVSCDNRTDELRLLGNGVVPATAALAFSSLIHQL